MIMIGRLAREYNMLPSMVDQNATTYDLMIFDVLAAFERYQQAKNKGGLVDASVYNLSTEQLMAIKDRTKK